MQTLPWLADDNLEFPAPEQALQQPPGLLCAGGDLSLARLERAYRQGIFPWFEPGSPILWWCPDPRTVLRPASFHVSRSLRRRLNQQDYRVTLNADFSAVVDGCAAPRRDADGTWITPEMHQAYEQMHRAGLAHSIEVWMADRTGAAQLGGGIYGVALGRCFFGESMFSKRTNGSKIALYYLMQFMREAGMPLLDCQLPNPHLARLGAHNMRRAAFLVEISQLCAQPGPSWHSRTLAGPPEGLR